MQNLYPLFERNRILKKELLWSLRDYSFSHVQLEYQEHGQGILRGCEVKVQGNQLCVGPGMVKYGQFICLLMEEQQIRYEAAEEMQYLKVKIGLDRSSQDCIAYKIDLLLDSRELREENEFELCRFNLRKGAQLRYQYTGFQDMDTEYDTVNLIRASWGALGGSSLSCPVTRYFGETILSFDNSPAEDRYFAYMCLNQPGAISPKVLVDYVRHRAGSPPDSLEDAGEIYKCLCGIVDEVGRGGGDGVRRKKERHRIVVD